MLSAHAIFTMLLLSSALVHMASNLNGLLLVSLSNQVQRIMGLWFELLAGKCSTPALGKAVLPNGLARALLSLYLMCAKAHSFVSPRVWVSHKSYINATRMFNEVLEMLSR